MRLLNGLIFRLGMVSQALDEMNARYRWEPLQVLHSELQRAVHHAVDHELMFFRIEIRNNGAAVSAHKMQRRRRDTPHLILQRSQDVKNKPELIG